MVIVLFVEAQIALFSAICCGSRMNTTRYVLRTYPKRTFLRDWLLFLNLLDYHFIDCPNGQHLDVVQKLRERLLQAVLSNR